MCKLQCVNHVSQWSIKLCFVRNLPVFCSRAGALVSHGVHDIVGDVFFPQTFQIMEGVNAISQNLVINSEKLVAAALARDEAAIPPLIESGNESIKKLLTLV